MKASVTKSAKRRVTAVVAGCIVVTCLAVPATASAQSRSNAASVVGVGDSFTSGEGNPPFVMGTDTTADQCHRSQAAYPIVAARLVGDIGRNVACSGATTADLFTTFNSESPQADRLHNADSVVVTIGGNDIGALQAVSTPPTPEQFAAALKALGPTLVATYQKLQQADPNGRIFAVAYPSIFSTAAAPQCPVSQAQRQFLVTATQALDSTIAQAAAAAHINYVDAFAAFAGHELCTTDPWVNGQDLQNPAFSLHPNRAGQAAIAQVVAASLKQAPCRHQGFFTKVF